MAKVTTGIVLEGGGHRGIYSAGVLDALAEDGIGVDGVIGASAGAIHGASFASGQTGRSIRYTEKYCADPRYMGLRSLLRTGDLFNADFCYREIPEVIDPYDHDALEKSPISLHVVCTDAVSGSPVYHRCETLRGGEIDWLRASASMPLAARMVDIEGKKLLDGGVSDSIPLGAFERMGYARNLVVLTQPVGYRKKPTKAMPLIRASLGKYPALVRAMETRHVEYNRALDEIERRARESEIFVIRPSTPVDCGRTERDAAKIRALYELGRADANAKLAEIRRFLGR